MDFFLSGCPLFLKGYNLAYVKKFLFHIIFLLVFHFFYLLSF